MTRAGSKLGWGPVAGLLLMACGGAAPASPAAVEGPAPAPIEPPAPLPVASRPDIDLQGPHVALVQGQAVPFDGLQEGLVWPALAKAIGPRRPGDVVTLQVARSVPVQDLERAAWTVRQADLRVQSPDAAGAVHAIELRARRDGAPLVAGCHLAVFLRPDGTLRVAAPGGPREIGGDDPGASLARSLRAEADRCPIKYVAFGAEADASPWGPVFDVMLAVDHAHAAGAARYVLAQAMHTAGAK